MLFLTYLLVIFCFNSQCLIPIAQSQLITEPPRNTTAPLGRNATFSCRGNGDLVWEISGTQIRDPRQIETFARRKIYSPIHRANSTEVFITATMQNNYTSVECLLGPANGTVVERSAVVRLLVYAEPYPPSDLVIEVDGLNLVVTWTEPFSLQGEEISYVVSITNMATRENREFIVNTTSYVFTEPFGDQRNCEEYEFSVFSMNGFSKSMNGISGRRFIPTAPLLLTPSDVQISVSLSTGARATVTFSSRDPCSTYPVTLYNFTIAERGTNDSLVSIQHNSDASLILDNANAGLLPNRVYSLFIEAENSVGSTLSEEIILYTTGLQSSSAVMELDGSITVTCTFATGASSTGCQVTIFNTDNTQVEILSENITRQNGDNEVTDSIVVPSGVPVDSMLLVQTAELLSGGQVGSVLFEGTVTVVTVTTATTASPTTTASTVEGTGEPTSLFNSTFYFIIGAVLGTIIILLLLIILSCCVICSLRRRRKQDRYPPANDEELKNNYCYNGTIVHHHEEEGGIHARLNTYDQSNNFNLAEDVPTGPVYETINEKHRMGNGASARPVPNPVYGGEVVHSGSKMADNPVYAEAGGAQGSASGRGRGPTLLSQTSTATDVSALNPVYSGVAVPLSPPHSDGSVFSISPSVVPQPSPGGAGAKSSGGAGYDSKLYSTPYATPNQSDDRYATVPMVVQVSGHQVPQTSPTHSSGSGEAKPFYSNAPARMVPTNPETGYSTLTREDAVEPPPGPIPVYEVIKVKDTRPPVRPDGDGVTLQSNTSYGLLLSDSSSPSHTPVPTPGSPMNVAPPHSPSPKERAPSSPLPPSSPPPQQRAPPPPSSPPPRERAPPVPNETGSQTSQL